MPLEKPYRLVAVAAAAVLALGNAAAQGAPASLRAGSGKLLLTGGVSSIDGAAGGGLTPWAVIGGYGAAGEIGATAFATRVQSQDYSLNIFGAAVGFADRFELSLARQDFDTGDTSAPTVLAGRPGVKLKLDIVGAKVRLFGDAVLDSDTWVPQVALGVEFKRLDAGDLKPALDSLGIKRSGTDVYLSATKLLLAQGVLLNGTLRATKANQNGLLGFGSATENSLSVQPEVSVAWLLRRNLAIGAEYRFKPDNLNPFPGFADGLKEDDWADVFIAWAPNKHLSLTLAAVDLGRVVPAVQTRRQTAGYLSAQVAF